MRQRVRNKTVLYHYVKQANKDMLAQRAKKMQISASLFLDLILDKVRAQEIKVRL